MVIAIYIRKRYAPRLTDFDEPDSTFPPATCLIVLITRDLYPC